jgi:diaminopimelate epimerase
MKIPFTKAHGTGNDFIIFVKESCPDYITDSQFIQQICKRKTGIGADSVLILSECSGYDFKMDYYNSDGSWETMCANGARCAGLLMYSTGKCSDKMTMLTGDGKHFIHIVDEDKIRLSMKTPTFKTDELEVNNYLGKHVDSGAKHFVTEIKNVSPHLVADIGPKIRNHNVFSPHGINVNCSEVLSKNTIKVITYEKGIEQVMLSCGSGATASAYYLAQKHNLVSPINIQVPGGELSVEFNSNWSEVWLTGPARIVFSSEIESSQFNIK